jgi:hypothetical protein
MVKRMDNVMGKKQVEGRFKYPLRWPVPLEISWNVSEEQRTKLKAPTEYGEQNNLTKGNRRFAI